MDYYNYSGNQQYDHQAQNIPHSGFEQGFSSRSMMEHQSAPPHGLESMHALPYVADCQNKIYSHASLAPTQPIAYGGPLVETASHFSPSPQDLSHLQAMYKAYVATYKDDQTPGSVRMATAKAFAEALLSYYYPESEGYIVQSSDLSPMAKHGMNFMLKTADGGDPQYHPLEPLPPLPAWKDPKKGKSKSKPPSKKTLQQREKRRQVEEYKRQFSRWYPYTTSVQWHAIEPEDIAMFEVLKEHNVTRDGGQVTELRLHTCLAIMLAPPDLISRMADTNDVHRADILADALCRSRDVQRGHGMLLFGPWMELYNFDNSEETQVAGDGKDEYYEGMVSCEEPSVRLCRAPNGSGLALDLRTVGLETVDEVCRMVVGNEVVGFREEAMVKSVQMSEQHGPSGSPADFHGYNIAHEQVVSLPVQSML